MWAHLHSSCVTLCGLRGIFFWQSYGDVGAFALLLHGHWWLCVVIRQSLISEHFFRAQGLHSAGSSSKVGMSASTPQIGLQPAIMR